MFRIDIINTLRTRINFKIDIINFPKIRIFKINTLSFLIIRARARINTLNCFRMKPGPKINIINFLKINFSINPLFPKMNVCRRFYSINILTLIINTLS